MLAELEDNDCHRTRTFPKTRLHHVRIGRYVILRGDVDKISGWRLHKQYGKDSALRLKDIIEGQKHDQVRQQILAKKERYE